ncbi:helix-turn-helix domain-containing protein [Lysinibacillus fusiformis]|uniref:helix-turn-helix domain-containing protein n=1 Tax=Lysinibacillus fusiformis TaxID=28031 RepID=UPI003AFAD16E
MPIRFTLAKTLHRYGIQQNRLAEESDTRPTTISQICRNDIKRVNVEMLDRIIPALERLTGAKHSLEDIMIYVRDEELDAD